MTDKLYLVNPPNPLNMKGFPGSLLALDLWVRDKVPDAGCTIIDEENTPIERLKESLSIKLTQAPKDVYFGLTCTTATYQDAIATAKAIKEILPSSKTILGGHHVNSQEEVILRNHPEFDLIVTGEGEKALESILKEKPLSSIPGVSYRKGNEIYSPPLNEKIGLRLMGERLSDLELNGLNIRRYNPNFRSTQFEESNLVTARGCKYTCAFCAVAAQRLTKKNIDTIVDEVDYIVEQDRKAGRKTIIAIQDNFFAQLPDRAKQIAEALFQYREKTGNKFDWNLQTRVEEFQDSELVKTLAKSGCSAAYFGVENFDPRMLTILNKSKNVKDYLGVTKKALENCLKNGIIPHIDFQVGIPGEDAQTERINEYALKEIGKLSKKLNGKPMVFPSLSVVYPATEFYRKMTDELKAPRDIYENFTEWERSNPEYRAMIYGYFAHGNGGVPLGIVNTSKLKYGQITIERQKLDRVKTYVDKLRRINSIIVHDFSKPKREVVYD